MAISQFSPLKLTGTEIVPKVSTWTLQVASINAASTVANTIGTTAQTTFFGDGSNLTGVGGSLQNSYNSGSDILVAASTPVQIRDAGAAYGASTILPGLILDVDTAGLSLGVISDGNNTDVPGFGLGQKSITDTAVVLSGATIDFGVDVTVAAGAVLQTLAIPGATTFFIAGGQISVKSSDGGSADEGQYTAVGVANGLATNSLVTVVDSLTQASPTFLGTSGNASAFNQSAGFNGTLNDGPTNAFLSLGNGDGQGTFTGVFSDSGSWDTLYSQFNIGNINTAMNLYLNGGPAVGFVADVPYIGFSHFGVPPNQADIVFAARATDPTISVTVGPATDISFTDSGGGDSDLITDAGGGLLAAGFRASSRVTITGSTSNDGSYDVLSVTDTVITLQDFETLTTEAAGASVTMVDATLQTGGMWYNTVAGNYKFFDGTAIQTFGGATRQTAYVAGNNLVIAGSQPLANRLEGIDYGTSNASGFITDVAVGSGTGSAFSSFINGTGGAPGELNRQKLVHDGATTVINDVLTDTTIAFTAASTITDSNSGFVAAGFQPGDSFDVTGTASNNKTFTISTVVAGTITVIETDVVTEAAGASVTLTGFTKLDFGGAINLSTLGVATQVGTYANVQAFSNGIATVKATDISPTDEGDFYPIINISDGVGTASRAQISSGFSTVNPAFTATTTTTMISQTYLNKGPIGHHYFNMPSSTLGVGTPMISVWNDGGSMAAGMTIRNIAGSSLAESGITIQNTDTSGNADVPMLLLANSGDSADIKLTARGGDVTLGNMGDGEIYYNNATDRIRARAAGAIESVAWLSDIGGAGTSLYTVTVNGGGGGDYTTLSAAITAAETRILVTGGTTEVASTTVTVNTQINILPGVNVAYGDFAIGLNDSQLRVTGGGGMSYAHTTGADFLQNIAGTNKVIMEDITIINTSTTSGALFCVNTIPQILDNVIFDLPNLGTNGVSIDTTDSLVTGCQFEGGGGTCTDGLTIARGAASDILFTGTWQGSGVALDMTSGNATVDGVTFSVSTNEPEISAQGILSNVTVTNADIDITVSADRTNVSNFDINGGIFRIASGIDDCNISNGLASGMSDIGVRNKYTNLNFAGTSTIAAARGKFTNCRWVGSTTITGDGNTFVASQCGNDGGGGANTFIVSASADKTTFIGCIVDAAGGITDGGTNTSEVATNTY